MVTTKANSTGPAKWSQPEIQLCREKTETKKYSNVRSYPINIIKNLLCIGYVIILHSIAVLWVLNVQLY